MISVPAPSSSSDSDRDSADDRRLRFTRQGGDCVSLTWSPSPEERPLELDALGFEVEFEHQTIRPGKVVAIDPASGQIEGRLGDGTEGETAFTVRWEAAGNLLRKQVVLRGRPTASWGRLLRLVVFRGSLPGERVDDAMGWRENPFEPIDAGRRSPEEGSGRMPPCGYPVFLSSHFAGLEHPMGFAQWREGSLELFHHPVWQGGSLASMTMALGHVPRGGEVRRVFLRYLETIRKPAPPKASVEVNTFWTDPCRVNVDGEVEYSVNLSAYEAMADQWIDGVLGGEQGLVSSFVLDAGWNDPKSLYRPKAELGGPGDERLAGLARRLDRSGLSLGLWISLNGPIGVHPTWAKSRGYTLSSEGVGAAYSASGNSRFICLDDRRWEDDFSARLDELNRNVPVAFYKGDWDNDGIVSEAQKTALSGPATIWEQNVDAMIRMYARVAPRGSEIRVRGGWWLSPWWFMHVDCTHLPHSGDLEACSLPALTQRDATLTSRDMMMFEHMVRHRSPVPWDVIVSHDFATAPRSPVHDTDESWLNNLVLWIARGGQAIQIYAPPYGIRGRRARGLRQLLRWFRDHEDLLWKSETAMLGGDPGLGEIYGYRHRLAGEELIVLRNPVGRPQAIPAALRAGIEEGSFSVLYPCRAAGGASGWLEWLPSNGVLVLSRGVGEASGFAPDRPSVIPELHAINSASVAVEKHGADAELWKVVVPHEYDAAEIVLEFPADAEGELCAAVGRYADGLSAAAVPITWLHSFWNRSYTEKRTRLSPGRWGRKIARLPVGPAGTSYLSLRKPFPAPLEIWLEARRSNEEDRAESRRLPLPPEARFVLVHRAGAGE